ncbi:hypothetical protein DS885_11800 [Psychromonas sp. B3M02]|uniref:hypothetical protein n=1 Tax=Psychromonas sp. B3M02 TaxID=2267226 RepID=UPI000DEA4609|nr:hypothetical protein [Psychromonas sp. B3M02]RBW43991.1 hypothetical protein DS885_11800 [Psychromonas sp. B3M02]
MKKTALILLGGVLLAGCQATNTDTTESTSTSTSSTVASLTNNLLETNFPSLTCAEIKQTFVDYEAKMTSVENGSSLLTTAGISTATATEKMQTSYDTAKEIATPVMTAKGCTETL